MRRRQRQRQFVRDLPNHCCPACHAVLYEAEVECLDCGITRPPLGWVSLHEQTDPWLGRILDGRYLITRPVGQGNSGTVYRAYSTTIHREFAVKFIDASIPDVRERLTREIGAMGHLKNPHVVPFYEVMEVEGFLIVVMDFIHGQTLHALMKQGRLSGERAANLGIQIANALHEAHTKGLVHRDIKPANIMIEQMPAGDDFVHVLDFGVVKFGQSHLTVGFIGTPMFSSPEQISGEDVDGRSDIYALGCVLFYMLTGELPFAAASVVGVMQKHLSTARPRISDFLDPCSTELDDLVFDMMSRDLVERPATMAEVAVRLSRVRHHRLGDSLSESLTESRAKVATQVANSKLLMQESLADVDAASFALGVEAEPGARLFASHKVTPLVLCNDRILQLNGQSLREALRVPMDTTAVTLSGLGWLLGTQSGKILVDDVLSFQTDTPIAGVAGDGHGGTWIVGGENGTVWRSQDRRERVWQVIRRGPRVTAVAIDHVGVLIAIARSTREVEILGDGQREIARITTTQPILGLAFSRDGYLLAVQCESMVVIVEPLTGRRVVAMRCPVMDVISFERQGLVGYGWKRNAIYGWNLERKFLD